IQFLLFVLLLGLCSGLVATPYQPQRGDPFLEKWRWSRFPHLAGKGVRALVEDAHGGMWFVINDGVTRYDGRNWQLFTAENGLPESHVNSIATGEHGEVFVSTAKTVTRYQNGEWTILFKSPGEQVWNFNNLTLTRDGSLWATCEPGLLCLRNRTKILHTSLQWKNSLQEFLPLIQYKLLPEALTNPYPFEPGHILEDDQERLWFPLPADRVACWDRTETDISKPDWYLYDQESGLKSFDFNDTKMYQSSDGRIWMITNDNTGIHVFDQKTWMIIDLVKIGSNNLHLSFIETSEGTIMIGGARTLNILRDNTWSYYEAPVAPIPSDRVLLYLDHNDYLWVTARAGEVLRLDLNDNRWMSFKNLNYQCETEDGIKWFLDIHGHAVSFDGEIWKSYGPDNGMIEFPNGLVYTPQAGLWAAGSHKQQAAFAFFKNGRWLTELHPELGYGIDPRNIVKDKEGRVYFGSFSWFRRDEAKYTGGILQYDPSKGAADDPSAWLALTPPKVHPTPYGIARAKEGTLWFATTSGLEYWDGETHGQYDDFPLSEIMQAIDIAPDGAIWAGSRQYGLMRLENSNVEQFTLEDGLADNSVQDILCTRDSSVWVATLNGISRFDGQKFITYALHQDIKIRANGGLLHEDKEGALWVNMASLTWYRRGYPGYPRDTNKFSHFQTIRYLPEEHPPETKIKVFNEKINQPGNALFSWHGNDYMENSQSSELEYSFRIDDREWSEFSKETFHTFLQFPTGHHTLMVRARDKDLNIDPTPARAEFYVVPPVWQQWWFILSIIAIITLIVIYEVRLIKRNKKIHELDLLRLNIFANISHELRTPLTLILGPLEKIITSGQGKKEQFELMYRNAQRLLHLVNQTLDLQKIEYKALQLNPVQGDVVLFLRHLFDSFKPYADEKKIDYRFHPDLPKLVIDFDPDKLEKIVFNLLSNAFKFTPVHGSVDLFVGIVHQDPSENQEESSREWLQVKVRDSGIGIAEKDLDFIFDRYFQVSIKNDSHISGSGIGLTLVKEMVSLHKGTISVTSKEDQGTEFTIQLPLSNDEELPESTDIVSDLQMNEQAGSEETRSRLLVLVIEDDPDMRTYFKQELGDSFNVRVASDGEQGIKLAVDLIPDIIISDLVMPKKDGLALCQTLKQNELTSHIPIIMITARHSESAKMQALKAQADAYLTKPFNMAELFTRIENLYEIRKQLQQKYVHELIVAQNKEQAFHPDDHFLSRVIKSIEDHLSESDLNIQILCKELHVSRMQLFRKVKSLTDKTPNRFIRQIRMQKAAQYLLTSDMNISEITFAVGFNDLHHFRKVFQDHFGKLPSDFKKSQTLI
ncbi:response regulator, partial [candidate division KSB1 bacterium]|nr:response regulator [candidate division KSB1 bacterium]